MKVPINVENINAYLILDDKIIEEEDRKTLPDRIMKAIDYFGSIHVDKETAAKFFNAEFNDFRDAVVQILSRPKYHLRNYFLDKEE